MIFHEWTIYVVRLYNLKEMKKIIVSVCELTGFQGCGNI